QQRFCQLERERLYQEVTDNPAATSVNDTVVTVCGNWVKVPKATYMNGTTPAHGVFKITRSIDEFGGIRYEILVCYIFSWFLVFIVCSQGGPTIGRVRAVLLVINLHCLQYASYITCPVARRILLYPNTPQLPHVSSLFSVATYFGLIPFATLIILAMNTLFYPHARTSLLEQLNPQWEHLISLSAWGDAAFSVLSGLAVGIGQLHAMASYNVFSSGSVYWALMVLPLFMTISNVLNFILVIGTTGSLAQHLGQCVIDSGTYAFAFPFVVYPEIVKTTQWTRLWSGLFYFTLFMISIDEMIFNVATVVTCAEDLFPNLRSNSNRTVFLICMSMFISGFPTVTHAGAYILKLLEELTVEGIVGHCIPMVEVATIMWLYGVRRFAFDYEFMLGRPPNLYFRICWTAVCPVLLAVLYIHRLSSYSPPKYFEIRFPGEYEALAWIIGCTGLLQIPIGAVACLLEKIRTPGRAFVPEYHWEPNTKDRVNAYFEELEEQGIEGDMSAEIQGVLYEGTEALEVSVDPQAPIRFQPPI
ncbi:unnamed protein product, partial [Ixodes hexagonus]